jgi:hypothetical protein
MVASCTGIGVNEGAEAMKLVEFLPGSMKLES